MIRSIRLLLAIFVMLPMLSHGSVLGGTIKAVCVDDPATPQREYYVEINIIRDHGSSITNTSDIYINDSVFALPLAYSYLIPNTMAPLEFIQYGDTLLFADYSAYWLEWQECCRSSLVQNVTSTDSVYIHAYLETGGSCNSLPELVAPLNPNWSATIGQAALTMYDRDHDSLLYAMSFPMIDDSTAAPFQIIQGTTSNPFTVDANGILRGDRVEQDGIFAYVIQVNPLDASGTSNGYVRLESVLGFSSQDAEIRVRPGAKITDRFHQWTSGKLDSVRWVVGSTPLANAKNYLPIHLQQALFRDSLGIAGDSAVVSFQWNPSTPEVGYRIPMVVRTQIGASRYDEVVWMFAKTGIGLKEWGLEAAVVYPNPSGGELHIETERGDLSYQLVDGFGRVLLDQLVENPGSIEDLDLALPEGVYHLLVYGSENRVRHVKWVIVK
ncbi:MAG: T9SS type A sorting domain-containing protein [Bacteroidetes bacterium]|nr:MAG: T9SS type A sorting domain-containing protein [Bacteroidota bacterium]